jgi:hypothetical protein
MVLRADGRVEHLPKAPTVREARALIGAEAVDGFSLRDGRYVFIDDAGHPKGLPLNAQATELYLGHLSKECNRTVIVDALMNEVRDRKTDLRVTVVDPLEDNPVSLW